MPIEATPMTSEEIDGNINSAFEIATYLRRNVVQGLRNEDGNYGTYIPLLHGQSYPQRGNLGL